MRSIAIRVPGGTVQATHQHLLYGPCVITSRVGAMVIIRSVEGGTALVPAESVRERAI